MKLARFELQGLRELDRQLARLEAGLPPQRKRAALHAGGQLIAEEAKRLAPVDTGTLRNSIKVTDDRDARVYGKLNSSDLAVYIGPVGSTEDGDVYYARFVEFGTRTVGAQPFMRPAIQAKRPQAEKLVLSILKADLLESIK